MNPMPPLPDDILQSLTALIGEGKPPENPVLGLAALNAAQWVAEAVGVTVIPVLSSDRSLFALADSLGCRLRQVQLQGAWWTADNGPLLAFNHEGRPFALLPNEAGYYFVKSGETAKLAPLTPEFAATLRPAAVMFYRAFENAPMGFRSLAQFAQSQLRHPLLKLFATQALMGLVSLLIPIAMGALFSEVIPNAEHPLLWQWTLLLMVGVSLTGLLAIHQALLFIRLRLKLNILFQSALWDRLLRLPLSLLHRFQVGDLALRSMAFDQCQQWLSSAVVQGLLAVVFAVFPLILMFYYSPLLASVALVGMLITLLFYAYVFFSMVRSHQQLIEQRSRLTSWVVQLIENVSRIRSNGAEERLFHVWLRQFASSVSTFYQLNRLSLWLSVWNAGVGVGLTLLLFAIAATRTSVIPFGDFIAFWSAFGLFSAAVFSLNQLLISLAPVTPWLKRAEPLLNALPEQSNEGLSVPLLQGRITFASVSFGYKDQPLILDDVSFSIEPGECIGIMGASGAGKSTLMRLLLGFLTPTHGDIFIDDHSLTHLNLSQYRRQLGVVLQQDTLLTGSILENLSDGLPLDNDKINTALARVSLTDMIARLPMGLHTQLTDNGLSLSQGERQRLLIARALIHEPKILIFDEATSALDNLTQLHIHESLSKTKQTMLLIAQRTSTLKHATRVYQLQAGKLLPA